MNLSPGILASGVHRVQVLATDIDGQAALTGSATLDVDGEAPAVAIRRTRTRPRGQCEDLRRGRRSRQERRQRQLRRRRAWAQEDLVQASLRARGDLHDRRPRSRQARQPGDRATAGEHSMKRALAVIACAVLAPLCTGGAPALGDVFGPISLVSQGSVPGASFVQQANSANDVAVSANGRYVAFDGSFAGHSGVFRRDLLSGEVASVAEGDAALPSISADGRYVSFTTTARLDAENDHNAAPDVYVRDMDRPSFQACPEGWEESESARKNAPSRSPPRSTDRPSGSPTPTGPNRPSDDPRLGGSWAVGPQRRWARGRVRDDGRLEPGQSRTVGGARRDRSRADSGAAGRRPLSRHADDAARQRAR